MKALMKTRPGDGNVELVEIPEPTCLSDGVKVAVKYGGICGTDIHVYHDTFLNYPPVILGHEFSGMVVEVGSNIRRSKPGDRVAVLGSTMVQCGTCEYCIQGYYMFCPIRRGMGHGVNGGFTRYVVVREDMVFRVADSVSFEEAALAEPMAVAVQAVNEITGFSVGDTVLLSGPGPIGLLCLILMLAHGCRVIVGGTAADKERLGLAKRLGADVIVDVTAEDLKKVVDRVTAGRGVDIAVECAGVPSSIASCLKLVRSMGKVIQLGIVGKEVPIELDNLIFKRIQLYGSVGHSRMTWARTVEILGQAKVNVKPVISHILPLSRWREGFDLCERKQGVKVLLACDE
jgi:L-iditol 2-dehydrogenase